MKRGRKEIPISDELVEKIKYLRSLGLSYEKITANLRESGHEVTVYRVKKIVRLV